MTISKSVGVVAGIATIGSFVALFFSGFLTREQDLEEIWSDLENYAFETLTWDNQRDGLLLLDTQLARLQRFVERHRTGDRDVGALKAEICGALEIVICERFSDPQYLSVRLQGYDNIIAFCSRGGNPERPIPCPE